MNQEQLYDKLEERTREIIALIKNNVFYRDEKNKSMLNAVVMFIELRYRLSPLEG